MTHVADHSTLFCLIFCRVKFAVKLPAPPPPPSHENFRVSHRTSARTRKAATLLFCPGWHAKHTAGAPPTTSTEKLQTAPQTRTINLVPAVLEPRQGGRSSVGHSLPRSRGAEGPRQGNSYSLQHECRAKSSSRGRDHRDDAFRCVLCTAPHRTDISEQRGSADGIQDLQGT